MPEQQYCLRWNNHHPNNVSVFSTLLYNELLVDVTIIAEGAEIHAHKLILSACSTYFQVSSWHESQLSNIYLYMDAICMQF